MGEPPPYEPVSSANILGVICDDRLGLAQPKESMLDRANIRHGTTARPARSSWGPGVGVLRTEHTALLGSIARYALVTVGSGAYNEHPRCLETHHTNIPVRRIVGISRSEGPMTLLMCAGIHSAHSLYIRQCALMLEWALRAADCSPQGRMTSGLEKEFQTRDWAPETQGVATPSEAGRGTGVRGMHESGVEGRQMVRLWGKTPVETSGFWPLRTFYTEADLIVAGAELVNEPTRTCARGRGGGRVYRSWRRRDGDRTVLGETTAIWRARFPPPCASRRRSWLGRRTRRSGTRIP